MHAEDCSAYTEDCLSHQEKVLHVDMGFSLWNMHVPAPNICNIHVADVYMHVADVNMHVTDVNMHVTDVNIQKWM